VIEVEVSWHAIMVSVWRACEDDRRATEEIAAGPTRDALHGIPIGLKDVYDTAGTAQRRCQDPCRPHPDERFDGGPQAARSFHRAARQGQHP
jgi:Asp-tRNA(Asn)/Glu-tRNA(Gln) amidotransferase A subunit family amidase